MNPTQRTSNHLMGFGQGFIAQIIVGRIRFASPFDLRYFGNSKLDNQSMAI
jgi:hypothetical protein